jgi:glycosyltransferase involved in cell wall biosynthesis
LTFWVSEPDNGQVNAINKGLHKTTGEIAAWLNSDDFYYPGVFAKAAEEFLKNPDIDLLYGDSVFVSEKGKALIKQTSEGINLRLLSIDSYIAQPSTFIKKDLIKKIGFLDHSFTNCFDYDFWIGAFKNGKTKYVPLLMSAMTISYKDRTFKNWNQTVEDCLKIQTEHFGSPSIKMYINLIASTSSKYIPHLNSRYLTIKHYLFGIIGYMQNNFFHPSRILKHLFAIFNLLYLRLVRRTWSWNRIEKD